MKWQHNTDQGMNMLHSRIFEADKMEHLGDGIFRFLNEKRYRDPQGNAESYVEWELVAVLRLGRGESLVLVNAETTSQSAD